MFPKILRLYFKMKSREMKIVSPCRAPNFSPREVETLIYQLELKPELIRSSARVTREGGKTSVLSMKDKINIWNDIANLVNIEGSSETTGVVRTAYEIKRKWNDLKSRVKIKAEDLRRGRLSDVKTPLSHLEERVLQLILKTGKAKDTEGLNNLLPPAYFHVGGKRFENLVTSPNRDENDSSSEETNDNDTNEIKVVNVQSIGSFMTVPTVSTMPIITLAAPSAEMKNTIQTETPHSSIKKENTDSNLEKWIEDEENDDSDLNDLNQNNILQMLSESQEQLEVISRELNDIKKTMYKINRLKQKRIEQENTKIQLKKMKLMLKCKEQGLDYEEVLSDFL